MTACNKCKNTAHLGPLVVPWGNVFKKKSMFLLVLAWIEAHSMWLMWCLQSFSRLSKSLMSDNEAVRTWELHGTTPRLFVSGEKYTCAALPRLAITMSVGHTLPFSSFNCMFYCNWGCFHRKTLPVLRVKSISAEWRNCLNWQQQRKVQFFFISSSLDHLDHLWCRQIIFTFCAKHLFGWPWLFRSLG